MFSQDKLIFTNKNAIKNIELFSLLKSEEMKQRLLYDMEKMFTVENIKFIRQLLSSNNVQYKICALNVISNLKATSELSKIEELLNDPIFDIKFHSIVVLGNIGQKETITKLFPFLGSTEQPFRRVAIEAIGKIDVDVALDNLSEIYEKEVDFGNRVAIIEAVKKSNNKNKLKNVLSFFLTIENVEFVKKIIEKYLNN